jgi:hypothetical protein
MIKVVHKNLLQDNAILLDGLGGIAQIFLAIAVCVYWVLWQGSPLEEEHLEALVDQVSYVADDDCGALKTKIQHVTRK